MIVIVVVRLYEWCVSVCVCSDAVANTVTDSTDATVAVAKFFFLFLLNFRWLVIRYLLSDRRF